MHANLRELCYSGTAGQCPQFNHPKGHLRHPSLPMAPHQLSRPQAQKAAPRVPGHRGDAARRQPSTGAPAPCSSLLQDRVSPSQLSFATCNH